ncbi:DUF1684 domain-containing protein [Demequina soli]|uniref:DUF1684 domain-containing protein n=1 Tax=Demequina soli TaxID=1638987 RepID=UPI000781F333|nr:DUF1684 domain-containing protein [Demequina soli]
MTLPASHDAWLAARDAAAFAPHGLAALARTAWLSDTPMEVPGTPGAWHLDAGVATNGDLRLAPGDEAPHGEVLLRAFARDGAVALRVLDPERPAREGLAAIERWPVDPDLVRPGRLDPMPSATTPTVAIDGHRGSTRYDGAVAFEVDGTALTLLVHREGDQLFAAFADATAADESYAFRMIRLAAPGPDGVVIVDLNRAYLPPSRFSPHFVCVTPPATNRWAVPVRGGERRIVPRDARQNSGAAVPASTSGTPAARTGPTLSR